MLDVRQTFVTSGGQSRLFKEILQVLKGGVAPVSGARATLGPHLSDDLGLR